MSPDELKRLRELANAASPGPWRWKGCGFGVGFCHGFQAGAEDRLEIGVANAAFIAATREAVPALLDLVDDLIFQRDSYVNSDFERQLAEARAEVARLERCIWPNGEQG